MESSCTTYSLADEMRDCDEVKIFAYSLIYFPLGENGMWTCEVQFFKKQTCTVFFLVMRIECLFRAQDKESKKLLYFYTQKYTIVTLSTKVSQEYVTSFLPRS